MKVTAIVQARMGSTRLPGKILKEVNGKPLLLHQIERLMRSKLINNLIIATTLNEQDDEVVDFCRKHNIDYYRGSEDNVLERYYKTWEQYGGEAIVRLTSDCPIIDPEIVDKTIQYFLDNSYDYVSNTVKRTFPRGLDTEIFSSKTLKLAYEQAMLDRDKEHVTAYIYTHLTDFNIGHYKNDKDLSAYRWTVDTEEDFELIKRILEAFDGQEEKLTLNSAAKLMEENPSWININKHIEQKKI